MEGGSSCSGIDLTSQNCYNWRSKDKSIALMKHVMFMRRVPAGFVLPGVF
jgi:hypothetical protein